MDGLNIKQKKFADFFIRTGNAAESYIQAGYMASGNSAEVCASRMLRNVKVIEYIQRRNERLDTEIIADLEETKRFWTTIMRDENADIRDRLKASEFIAKTNGAFIEKKEVLGGINNKIEFGFIDPTLDD
ncbi:terminase small subunit [Bacillus sp. 17376]|nr:terminase small subunit [Bacillus sp. 17376]